MGQQLKDKKNYREITKGQQPRITMKGCQRLVSRTTHLGCDKGQGAEVSDLPLTNIKKCPILNNMLLGKMP